MSICSSWSRCIRTDRISYRARRVFSGGPQFVEKGLYVNRWDRGKGERNRRHVGPDGPACLFHILFYKRPGRLPGPSAQWLTGIFSLFAQPAGKDRCGLSAGSVTSGIQPDLAVRIHGAADDLLGNRPVHGVLRPLGDSVPIRETAQVVFRHLFHLGVAVEERRNLLMAYIGVRRKGSAARPQTFYSELLW